MFKEINRNCKKGRVMNTYIIVISNDESSPKHIIVEKETREKAIIEAKSQIFPSEVTDGKSIMEIHDMFVDLGYYFSSTILVRGLDYKVTKLS